VEAWVCIKMRIYFQVEMWGGGEKREMDMHLDQLSLRATRRVWAEENLNFIKNLLKISDLRPGGGGKGEEKGLKEGIDLRAN